MSTVLSASLAAAFPFFFFFSSAFRPRGREVLRGGGVTRVTRTDQPAPLPCHRVSPRPNALPPIVVYHLGVIHILRQIFQAKIFAGNPPFRPTARKFWTCFGRLSKTLGFGPQKF